MGTGVFCILLLSACGMVAQAQSPTRNYFLGRQMLDANGSQAITTITYYDDLGYEDEVATTGLNGQGSYVYTKKEYNIPGQVTKEWIPGARSVYGEYLDASSLAASSCSFFKDGYPFVTNEYDALGRVVSTMQPGANWVNAHRAVRKRYAINADCPSAPVSLNISESGLCNSGYSSTYSLGLKNEQLLQANYYDNHNFLTAQLTRKASSHSLAATCGAKEECSMGSLTGNVCADTNGNPLVSVYYHNMRGQVIERVCKPCPMMLCYPKPCRTPSPRPPS